FERDASGGLKRLPSPNIDTGMGLERITAVLQGVHSNYDTDLFTGLIDFISKTAGTRYRTSEDTDVSIRVIADHARACAFLVADGVLPSNEGRGYVLRRIIRRASRHGKMLGLDRPFLHRVAVRVAEEMGGVYTDLASRAEFVARVIEAEEERFLKTLDRGLGLLDEIVRDLKSKGETVMRGEDVFVLYDTFGFPVDLTADIARRHGIELDTAGFEAQMELQREKARSASSFGGFEAGEALAGNTRVRFVGYDTLEADGSILQILAADSPDRTVESAKEGDEVLIVTDTTPFYGESGGQVGDTGRMDGPSGTAEVVDTFKTETDAIVHRVRVSSGSLCPGDDVRLTVDALRRRSIMRHHSA
ncbi:MAG TPA: alanine--tRNA ligase-related protein, partial [Deltaproteobacteria bacterium]|nr:alanine--tRNA ligase-related protein [Deltaproteobacteria bacterium]